MGASRSWPGARCEDGVAALSSLAVEQVVPEARAWYGLALARDAPQLQDPDRALSPPHPTVDATALTSSANRIDHRAAAIGSAKLQRTFHLGWSMVIYQVFPIQEATGILRRRFHHSRTMDICRRESIEPRSMRSKTGSPMSRNCGRCKWSPVGGSWTWRSAAGVERIVINGSFVTDICEPNDVDCVLLIGTGFPHDPGAEAELIQGLPFLDIDLVRRRLG